MDTDTVRYARMNKIAMDATTLMQSFVDEIDSSEELADTVGAWSQVLGALIAQGHKVVTEETLEQTMPFVREHIRIAYEHNMEKKDEKD